MGVDRWSENWADWVVVLKGSSKTNLRTEIIL